MAVEVPFISVVLPCRNAGNSVPETLRRLKGQTYPADRFEIIVVDGDSTDETADVTRRTLHGFPQWCILSNPKRLSSSSRNLGVGAARGEIVAFIEAHCWVEPDFLERAAEILRDPMVCCVGRPIEPIPAGSSGCARAIVAARVSPFGHSAKSFIYRSGHGSAPAMSMATIYRRDVFDRVGGFCEDLDACEDLEFNWRVECAGLRTYFSDRLHVRYLARGTLRDLFVQMLRYGHGRFRYIRKHARAIDVETLVPPAFSLGVLALPLVGAASLFVGWPWAAALLGPYAAYAAITLAASLRIAARSGWTLLPYLPPAFFAIHFGLGCGFLRGAVESCRGKGTRPGCAPDIRAARDTIERSGPGEIRERTVR